MFLGLGVLGVLTVWQIKGQQSKELKAASECCYVREKCQISQGVVFLIFCVLFVLPV